MVSPSPKQKHFYWLDWFRFLAAFEVVAYHVRGHTWTHYDQLQAGSKDWLTWIFFVVTHWGGEAVVLFFVLSGFLVGGKVLQRTFDRSFDLEAYALDRITRIYLPLVPALLVSGVIGCGFLGQRFSLFDLVGNLAGLQSVCCHAYAGNLPLWTLAYEMWFYVLGGLVAVLISGKSFAKAVSLCGIMFVFALFTRLDASLLFCWCLGALGYFLALADDVPPLVFPAGLALAGFGLTFFEYISAHQSSFGNFLSSGRVADLIFSLGLAITFAFVSRRVPVSKPAQWLEKAGARLATFSYTLYLTHFPFVSLWTKFRPEKYSALDLHSFMWFILECAACVLFAFIVYLPFEAQTARVRGWLKRIGGKGIEANRING
jgi:peptidoglycan/LPS O-acetylase OafA/YrhL